MENSMRDLVEKTKAQILELVTELNKKADEMEKAGAEEKPTDD